MEYSIKPVLSWVKVGSFGNPFWVATWAFELVTDRLRSARHRVRIGEYQSYEEDVTGALARASAKPRQELADVAQESERREAALTRDAPPWAASRELTTLLYGLTRSLKPQVVVETGIGAGVSSRAILLAFEENARGHLSSIELPNPRIGTLPRVGYLVPGSLEQRWTRLYGASRRLLPKLLRELGEIDIFLHDSRHSYHNQRTEYRTAWPHLRPGGVLISDDVGNDALLEMADAWKVAPIIVRQQGKEAPLGLLVKP